MRNNFWILVVALLLSAGCCKGQEQYPFIRYNANVLHYDSSSATMKYFFQKCNKLASTGKGL